MKPLAAALLLTGLAGCSGPAPDVAFLASDAHFVVADQRVVLPFVALHGVSPLSQDGAAPPADVAVTDPKITEVAGSVATPSRAAALTIVVREYRSHGEHAGAVAICPRLTRKWAQLMCRGERVGVLQDLPAQFDLVDRRHMARFRTVVMPGGERRSDQIARMELASGRPDVVCGGSACTAAVALSDTVAAVWTVSATPGETAEQIGRRQGAAILTFVRNAIGEREAFERLGVPMPASRA